MTNSKFRFYAIVVILGATAFVGCSDDKSTSPESGDGGIDAGSLGSGSDAGSVIKGGGGQTMTPATVDCDQVAKTFCGAINKCVSLFVKQAWGDVATCETRVKLSCTDEVAAPDSGYSPSAVAGCIAAVQGASCTALLDNTVVGCQLPGTRADGLACGFGSQCKSGFCRKAGTCGVCGARPAAGDACNENGDCVTGLVCNGDNGKKRCVAPVAAGQTCSATQPCVSGQSCKVGTCTALAGAGQQCWGEGSCDIAQSLFCNTGPKLCQIAKMAAPGEACGFVDGNLYLCTAGGECRGTSVLNPRGVCSSTAADGVACGGAQALSCFGPATCEQGSCKLPNAAACK